MKKLLFFILLLSFYMSLSAQDTLKDPSSPVSLDIIRYEQLGDSVYVEIDLKFQRKIHGWDSFVLSPVLQSGNQVVPLTGSRWLGRREYLSLQRYASSSDGNSQIWPKSSKKARYTVRFPYHTWMSNQPLSLRLELLDCCSSDPVWKNTLTTQGMKMDLLPVPDSYVMQPQVSFVRPDATPVKSRSDAGSSFLEFKAGASALLLDYANNAQEVARIRKAIDTLMLNKDASITSITVKGFASFDGSAAKNLQLSGARAEALRKYLASNYTIDPKLFKSESGGEDWEGFRQEVEAADFTLKESVLKIVDSTLSADAKDAKLKQLDGGRFYHRIKTEYFPKLRRVDYTLNYTVKAFTVEEGKELLKVSPGKLSLNELFLIANTYPVGSAAYLDVFDVAVRLFPSDPVARINAAGVALEKGDLEAARKYLSGLDKDGRAFNNYALLLIAQGDIKEAKEFLLKAQSAGVEQAEPNLQELKKYTEREDLIREIKEKNQR